MDFLWALYCFYCSRTQNHWHIFILFKVCFICSRLMISYKDIVPKFVYLATYGIYTPTIHKDKLL